MNVKSLLLIALGILAALFGVSGLPLIAFAHCDTMGGPGIQAAGGGHQHR